MRSRTKAIRLTIGAKRMARYNRIITVEEEEDPRGGEKIKEIKRRLCKFNSPPGPFVR